MSGRIDTRRLYNALDGQRQARNQSWRQVATEAGVSPSLLSRMRNEHRPDLDGFVALVQWLGLPAESFMVEQGQEEVTPEPEFEAQFAPLLRARSDFNEAEQEYLMDIVSATMKKIRADRRER
ncbi:helix-turn-helix transcriptional regulator [Amycolatopsis rhabdoformis]|uniref:Helix-turn-helix transcriptional regulator n=1 Tax=Amycolatopsis rhabdoformis TaxID=1448059 RepID=A0ABZ1IMQ1_9PSEU|nr:helix-turn-helix transcriptional regulator [Amycolatopsis rhabdoformis]WSE35001.1 helix-turn-helix transcriptional regulator [Amycolatopsis rhabdoformis]